MFRGGIGWPEILLILAVVVLLFGAAKLPELARGSGRALRIFKAETKGLLDDDKDDAANDHDSTTRRQLDGSGPGGSGTSAQGTVRESSEGEGPGRHSQPTD